jgi:cell division septum initiation protein DivIVA
VLLLNELKKEHEEAQQQRQRIDVLEQQLTELLKARETSAPTIH